MNLQDHSRYLFFNGTKGILNFNYNSVDNIWTGSIHLNEVSTGLFETVSLAIIEEVYDNDGNVRYVKPIANNGELATIAAKMVTSNYTSNDIFLFDTVLGENNDIEVSKITSKSLDIDNSSIADHNNPSYKIITNFTDIHEEAIIFNLALHSETEGSHVRWVELVMSTGQVIAYIKIYGEVTGEDERLGVLLDNFGMSVSEGDMVLFKEHDINEAGTNWLLLNAKRKEMLIEGHNIKPYIGTYKALINAIKFYGYNNLTIKEYWLDINKKSQNFGKLRAVPVTDVDSPGYSVNKSTGVNKPSGTAKKTSRFSLTYRINKPTGFFDEFDTPLVKEVFDFSPEEVLVKLYALKNKLQRHYLPLYAKIVDITGEADIFGVKNTNVSTNVNPIGFIDGGIDLKYSVFPNKTLFIENLEKISSIFTNTYNDFTNLPKTIDSITYTKENLISSIKSFYESYYNLSLEDNELTPFDNNGPIAGAPLILKFDGFQDLWNEMEENYTWNDFNHDTFNQWNNYWSKNSYEIEWTITGPNGYNLVTKGPIGYWSEIASSTPSGLQAVWNSEFSELPFALPFVGNYNITLKVYDLYNYVSQIVEYDKISVTNKEVCIYGLYKYREENYTWNNYNDAWRATSSSWNLPVNNQVMIQDIPASAYLTLDRYNYSYNNDNPDLSTITRYKDLESEFGWSETAGPYFWNNLGDANWNDSSNLWWEATEIGPDQNSSFKILEIENGSTLSVFHKVPESAQIVYGSYTITSPTPTSSNDVAGWQLIANELNLVSNNIISKFTFNPVFEDTNNDGINNVCLYILAVGKEYSAHYDFEEAILTQGEIYSGQHYLSRNPTWNDTIFFEGHAVVNKLTHVTFALDKTAMPGKTKPRWTLKNESQNSPDIYYDNMWFTYLFKNSGTYSLSLELEDSNGNTNLIKKNIITIK